jgi:hypothetical protein
MSEFFSLLLAFLIGVFFGIKLAAQAFQEHIEDDPAPADMSDRIEQLEVEIIEQNGILYCWSKDPIEGYSFVGQAATKELLEQQFLEFARKKYATS